MRTIVKVPSSSQPGVEYPVVVENGRAVSCPCKGWTQRVGPNGERTCQHLRKVNAGLAPRPKMVKVAARPEPGRFTVTVDTSVQTSAPGRLPTYVRPMLATPLQGDTPIDDRDFRGWWLEEKYRGVRVTIHVEQLGAGFASRGRLRDVQSKVACWSRPGPGKTAGLPRTLPPHIEQLLKAFPAGVYDGELFVPGGHESDLHGAGTKARLAIFDVTVLDGENLCSRDAAFRRNKLEGLANGLRSARIVAVFIAPIYPVSQKEVAAIYRRGGEGAILKRKAGLYQPGYRSPDWIKVKRRIGEDAIITGFRTTAASGACAVVEVLAGDREMTAKTPTEAQRKQFAANPEAFINRPCRIEHGGIVNGKIVGPVTFDHLIEGGRRRAR